MEISNEIIQLIKQPWHTIIPITKDSNIYTDLGYDSLDFMGLLVTIEKKYSINFELIEMQTCLKVGSLIDLVKMKVLNIK